MDSVVLIRKSLTAFTCGLIGLLPGIGVPFGMAALVFFIQLRSREDAGWNPAERYLDWSARFALLGFVITLLLIALVMAAAIQSGTGAR